MPFAHDAHAHTEGSPTLLGTSSGASLTAPPATRWPIGELLPPPGRYCTIRRTIVPADADAVGLPSPAMVGASLVLAGTYTRLGAAPRSFRLVSAVSFVAEAHVPAFVLGERSARRVEIVLTTTAERWFVGVDLEGGDDDTRARAVLANIRDSLGARAE